MTRSKVGVEFLRMMALLFKIYTFTYSGILFLRLLISSLQPSRCSHHLAIALYQLVFVEAIRYIVVL